MKRVLRALVNHNPDQRPELFRDNSSRCASVQNLSCKTVTVGSYQLSIEETIAEGGFALVFLAKAPNGQKFALKRMFVNNEQDLGVCRREIEIMKYLRHNRNVVQLVESSIKPSGEGIYEVMILMDYCNDSLLNLMNDRIQSGFSEKEILDIFCDVCSALLDIHLNDPPIIHRDLKIENILIDNHGRYLVCDFGSATFDDSLEPDDCSDGSDEPPPPPSRSTSLSSIDQAAQSSSAINKVPPGNPKKDKSSQRSKKMLPPVDYFTEKTTGPAKVQSKLNQRRKLSRKREQKTVAQMEEEIKKYTTLSYRAPELVDLYNNIPITVKSDIWALGCLLYKLCFFNLPFGESVLAIQNGTFTIPEDSEYSPSLHRLILYMLDTNVETRPNIKKVTSVAFKIAGKQNMIPKEALDEPCPDINTLNLPMTDSEFRNEMKQNSSTSSSHRSNSSSVNPDNNLNSPCNHETNNKRNNSTIGPTAPITITSTSVAPVQRPRKNQRHPLIPTPPPPSLQNSSINQNWCGNSSVADPKVACRSVSPRPHSSATENDDINFGLEFDELRRRNTGRSNDDLIMSDCERHLPGLVSHSQSDTRLAASLNPFETSSSANSIDKDTQREDTPGFLNRSKIYAPSKHERDKNTDSAQSTNEALIDNQDSPKMTSREELRLREVCDNILNSSESHRSSRRSEILFEDFTDEQASDSSLESDEADADMCSGIAHMRLDAEDSPQPLYHDRKCDILSNSAINPTKSIWSVEIKDKESVSNRNRGNHSSVTSLKLKPPPSGNSSRSKQNLLPSSIPRQKVIRAAQESSVIGKVGTKKVGMSQGGHNVEREDYNKNGVICHDRLDLLIGHTDGHRPLLDDEDSGEEGTNRANLVNSLVDSFQGTHDHL